jgi:hypothetical protein
MGVSEGDGDGDGEAEIVMAGGALRGSEASAEDRNSMLETAAIVSRRPVRARPTRRVTD